MKYYVIDDPNKTEKLERLYNWIQSQIPEAKDLRTTQIKLLDSIHGDVDHRDHEANDNRVWDLLEYNMEYGAIQALYPNCKVISLDFEGYEMSDLKEVEDDMSKLGAIFDGDYDVAKRILGEDPSAIQFPSNCTYSFSPMLWISDYHGIIHCEDHDGTTGGCSWGYAIIKDGKLVWDGTIPEMKEMKDQTLNQILGSIIEI